MPFEMLDYLRTAHSVVEAMVMVAPTAVIAGLLVWIGWPTS